MSLASTSGYAALARAGHDGVGCLLTFHRVASAENWEQLPDRDYYINAKFLDGLLDYVTRAGYDVLSMDDVLTRTRAGQGGRYVNFSIDDVYRDTWELAMPIFRRRNLPVTLFVTSGIPDGTMSLWYVGLETILHAEREVKLLDGSSAAAATGEEKRNLFQSLSAEWGRGDAQSQFNHFCTLNGYDSMDLHQRNAVTWKMLDELRDDPCAEIGGHTVTHPRLAAMPIDAARREIEGCRSRLQERLGLPIRHFAYPFGRKNDCGPREFALARAAGYDTACTTRKGLMRPADSAHLFSLPRNTLNGSHQRNSQVETHLSGVSGLVAQVLGAT